VGFGREFGGFRQIMGSKRTFGNFDGDGAQLALVEQKTAPLRWELGNLLT
jgi:hypothetical protein